MKKYSKVSLCLITLAWIFGWFMVSTFNDIAFKVLSIAVFTFCVASSVSSVIDGKRNSWWPWPVLTLAVSVFTTGFFVLTEFVIYTLSNIQPC